MPRRPRKKGLIQYRNCATENEQTADPVQSDDIRITRTLHPIRNSIEFRPPPYAWQEEQCRRLGCEFQPIPISYVSQESISSDNFVIHDVGGDGNCLFRALAFVVTGDEDNHLLIRRCLTAYMRQYKDNAKHYIIRESRENSFSLDQNFEDHMNEIERNGTWGTQAEVIAAASMFQTDIQMYQVTYTTVGVRTDWHTYGADILLQCNMAHHNCSFYLNHTGNHYNVILGNQRPRLRRPVSPSLGDVKRQKVDYNNDSVGNLQKVLMVCPNCGKEFKNLKLHLAKKPECKNAQTCSELNQLMKHETTRTRARQAAYRQKNLLLIKEKKKVYREQNRNKIENYNKQKQEVIKEKQKIYNLANKERVRCWQKTYNLQNKDNIKEKQEEYNRENQEIIKNKQTEYNRENQEKIRDKQTEYNRENQEKIRGKQTEYNRDNRDEIKNKQKSYDLRNRKKVRDKQEKYDKKNKEKVNEKQQRYAIANKEKVQRKQLKYDTSRREQIDESMRLKKFQLEVRNGPIFPCSSCQRLLFLNGVRTVTNKFKERVNLSHADFYNNMVEEIRAFDGEIYLCHSCRRYLDKGRCPPLSIKNGLSVDETPAALELSELESVLIAKNILFFKIFKLPKTRWSGIRDKLVNVPINDNDLLKTLSELTELPRAPGNAGLLPVQLKRKVEYKNVVLESYIDPAKLITAVHVLKQLGHPGYVNVTINANFAEQLKEQIHNVYDESVELDPFINSEQIPIKEDNSDCDDDDDNISKFHFKGNTSCIMDNDCPEISLVDAPKSKTHTNSHPIAPGEGKIPSNLMRDRDWDVNSFPQLHPTGKFGLNFSRSIKLAPWKYFTQRLYNINTKFASTAPYLFASLYYLERHQLEQQINISYLRGNVNNGILQEMNDPYAVLDPVPNSPRYCQKKRFEMMAKLENLGPFSFFWTLSSGEVRWMENFTSVLALQGKTVSYETDGTILVDNEPLEKFLQNASLHELVRKNVLIVTRNFNNRVKAMVRNIIIGKNNPMCPTWYNYRVEFQVRGAPHIHGVLWVDYAKIEEIIPGITDSMKSLRNQKRLTNEQCKIVKTFVDRFTSCSLANEEVADKVRQVQIHKHTRTCCKKGGICRFGFPRFPSERTIIAQPLPRENFSSESEYDEVKKRYQTILNTIKGALNELRESEYDTVSLDDILSNNNIKKADYYAALGTTCRGTVIILKRKVNEMFVNNYNAEWLNVWDANMDIQVCLDYYGVITYITDYYTKDESGTMPFLIAALKEFNDKEPSKKMRIIADTFLTHRLKGECEALYCIDPNLHLTDSNIKTVWVDTNIPSKRRKFLKKISDDNEYDDEYLRKCDDNHGEPEIVNNEESSNVSKTISIPGKSGKYVLNSSSIHQKYALRPVSLCNMPLAQFAISYDTCAATTKCAKHFDKGDVKYSSQIVVTGTRDSDTCANTQYLPEVINVGGQFMKLRSQRAVLRQKKYREDIEPHAFMYSELLLYNPWFDEADLSSDDCNMCLTLYRNNRHTIENVKNSLFPHKNNVEQGRAFLDALGDVHASHFGTQLDAEHEHAQDSDAEAGMEVEDNDILRYPGDFLNEQSDTMEHGSSIYRRIDISDTKAMAADVQRLDSDQRKVFDIAIGYARDVRKMSEDHLGKRNVPLLVVHGGAGTGKSFLIKTIAKWTEATLRSDNDRHPDQPFILLTAPTGTAAKNINGLTLHSTFNMPFGNGFLSLSDKQRDKKRSELSKLKILIIDEFSMVKSDMLYQLNMRLKEIKQNDNDFGGIGVFLFGDIMQLRPVKAKYIFQKPQNEKFALSYLARSLWQQFTVIELTQNHRQGRDGEYADMLNRIRFATCTERDIELLKTRNAIHLPTKAVHLFATNAEVDHYNTERLNEIEGDAVELPAINVHPTITSYQPHVNRNGNVHDTPLLAVLKLKKNVRVFVTYNVDISDGMVNGSLGTVREFIYSPIGQVCTILIEYDDRETGCKARQSAQREDHLTPLSRISLEYTVGKKRLQNSTRVKCMQFPLKLAWAATVHKFQGQTISQPTLLVGHMERMNQAAQVYVMLGRIQSISQLYLSSFDVRKIRVHEEALVEANRLHSTALNTTASLWEKSCGLKVSHLNIRSLVKHIDDLRCDHVLLGSNIICLSETWMPNECDSQITLPGYNVLLNGVGRGRGIAIYYNLNNMKYQHICNHPAQVSRLSIHDYDLFVIYQPPNCSLTELLFHIEKHILYDRKTVLCGDFNWDLLKNNRNCVHNFLSDRGFKQLISSPTHILGGLLDHVYTNTKQVHTIIHPTYYSDHDATCIILNHNM